MESTLLALADRFRQSGLFGARILCTILIVSFGGIGNNYSTALSSSGTLNLDANKSFHVDNELFSDIAFSPDGSTIAILSQPIGSGFGYGAFAKIHIVNVGTMKEFGSIISPFSLRGWSIDNRDENYEPNTHMSCDFISTCGSVAISGNGMVAMAIAAGDYGGDGKIGLWNYIDGKPIMIKGAKLDQSDYTARVWFSTDDSLLGFDGFGWLGGYGGLTALFRTMDGIELKIQGQSGGPISKLLQVVVGDRNELFRTLDWRTWGTIPSPGIKSPIAVSEDGELFFNFNYLSSSLGLWRVNPSGIGNQAILNIPIPRSVDGKSHCSYQLRGYISQDKKTASILSIYAKGTCGMSTAFTKDQMGNLMVWDISAKKQLFSTTFPMVKNVVAAFRNDGMAIAYVSSWNTVDVLEVPVEAQ